MRTKIVQEETMLALTVDEARRRASALVRREEYRVGSRMVAYENIGQMIGKSGMWVRRFIKGYADVTPSFPVGMNIIALYDQLCLRIERDTDRRNANAADTRHHQEHPRETSRASAEPANSPRLGEDDEDKAGSVTSIRE